MDIALYYAPISCALAPYITLTEAGAAFEVRPINLQRQQQMSPEYMEINPRHKVPLLVVDGEALTENTAIQVWIARTFPEARLLPEDPWQELEAIALHAWCSSGIHPYLTRIFAPPRVCDLPGAEKNVVGQTTFPKHSELPREFWRAARISLTGSPRLTRTSSGVAGAPRSSVSTSPLSPTRPHISSACRAARASRTSWPTKRR